MPRSVLAAALAAAMVLAACRDGTTAPGTTDRSPAAVATTARPPTPGPTGATATDEVARLRVEVVARYPHDPGAFTQGLVLIDGELYESTGLIGQSSVRRVELRTGTVRLRRDVAPPLFGEGLAAVGDELYQLTWTSGVALVFDRATLTLRRELRYQGEGWGLCHDGTTLVQSDGSATLIRRDPTSFAALRTIEVRERGRPVEQLNELECVGGDVYANIWLSSDIVRIDGATGMVTARIDASALQPVAVPTPTAPGREPTASADDVLNGIAFDPADGTFLLTGKRWDSVYRVRFTG